VAAEGTTTPTVYVTVNVTLSSSKVTLTPKSVPRGASARFVMRNIGPKPVVFSVGSQTPGLGVRFGFRTVVKPSKPQILLLYLSSRGLVPYYVGKSYAAARSGTKGQLIVGAACARCAPPGPPPLP
jgi:hypothetical protein